MLSNMLSEVRENITDLGKGPSHEGIGQKDPLWGVQNLMHAQGLRRLAIALQGGADAGGVEDGVDIQEACPPYR